MGDERTDDLKNQERAAHTQSLLVTAAAQIFAEHGYEAASLSTITGAAGVSGGGFYFHFDSKKEVARELIRIEGALARELTEAVIARNLSALQTVITLGTEWAGLIVSNPVVSAGVRLTMERPDLVDDIYAQYQYWMGVTEDLLQRAYDNKEITPQVSINVIAHLLTANFVGLDLLSNLLTKHNDFEQRITDMWAFA